ncbi:MAG: phosphohistidine phosphatase SixA [Candidatus Methylomirabilales bacterium]
MRCYLVRHGEAKSEAEDPARPLSERGREEVTRVAKHVRILGLQIAEIHHSDKLRARQTAEILAEFLSPARGIHEMEGLAPMDHPSKAQAALEAASEPLMLVGHLPHLSRLASALLLGDSEQEILQFTPGAMACLVTDEWIFRVEWVLTPELATPHPSV